LKSNPKSDFQARTTMDTLGLTIVTDLIKQVTLGDYTSYTMEIVNQKDTIVFYNLTIEYKNGESSMFVTKYIPDEYWLNNKDELYSGGIFSKGVNKLKVHTELDDLFADNEGGTINGNDLGLGSGAGGGGG
jgi:DNA-binding GntR family transcriptional regulator